uniref:Uncharacterized protein n=1 Tax=Cacopsylla melanoneura TaxID=428564 RepID=A0A8D8Q1N9_9HEMI
MGRVRTSATASRTARPISVLNRKNWYAMNAPATRLLQFALNSHSIPLKMMYLRHRWEKIDLMKDILNFVEVSAVSRLRGSSRRIRVALTHTFRTKWVRTPKSQSWAFSCF